MVNTFEYSLKMSWFESICQTISLHQRSWVIFFHHRWRLFLLNLANMPQPEPHNQHTHSANSGRHFLSFREKNSFRFCLQSIKKTQKKKSPHLERSTLCVHTLGRLRDKITAAHTLHWESITDASTLFRLSPFSSAFSFQTAPPSGPLSPCPWIGPAAWRVSCRHKTRRRKK